MNLKIKYKKYHFDSIAAARWAVFFDTIGIDYHYKYDEHILRNGTKYKPDFYLPHFYPIAYAHVKQSFSEDDIIDCYELCTKTKRVVIRLEGSPDFKCVKYFEPETEWCREKKLFVCNGKILDMFGLIKAGQAYDENRIFYFPWYANADLTISEENFHCLREEFIDAVNAAKTKVFSK